MLHTGSNLLMLVFSNWRINNNGRKLLRNEFSNTLKKTLDGTLSQQIIQSAFRACGLVPLDENNIDFSKYIKVKANVASSGESLKERALSNNDLVNEEIIRNNPNDFIAYLERLNSPREV